MLVCSGLTVLAYMAPEPKIMLNALGQDKKKKKKKWARPALVLSEFSGPES